MNIYKCTTWLGTHLLFCADSTAGLISCRRDFGRSKMHTTPDIHLGIMRIMHSPLYCIYLPRISQDQIYLLKKFSRSLPESLLNDLAIRWNYSRSTRIAVDSAKPMACCQYTATEARSRILRHFSLSLASMPAACENKQILSKNDIYI